MGFELLTCCGSPAYAAPELVQGKAYIGSEVSVAYVFHVQCFWKQWQIKHVYFLWSHGTCVSGWCVEYGRIALRFTVWFSSVWWWQLYGPLQKNHSKFVLHVIIKSHHNYLFIHAFIRLPK